MATFQTSLKKTFFYAISAYKRFPFTISCAFLFAVVTGIRIQLDWVAQEQWNFLFNTLHFTLAFGAIAGLSFTAGEKSICNQKKTKYISFLLVLIITLLTGVLLYVFGGTNDLTRRYQQLTQLSILRVLMGMLIFMLAFLVIAGRSSKETDLAKSFFMVHKAFFIALIYGSVLFAGTSGIAGVVQALLYSNMTEKVYMYLATISGFVMFTLFVGYFPDFEKDSVDEHLKPSQEIPKFIKVLLNYIIIPIVFALTVVLLLWTARIIFSGIQTAFQQLVTISTIYSVAGIWLYIFVTHEEHALAIWYRKLYPIAAIIILIAEGWALIQQIYNHSVTPDVYVFALTWCGSLISILLLLFMKAKAQEFIFVVIAALALISVFPFLGYHSIPYRFQMHRLENILIAEDMLIDGKIQNASKEVSEDTKIAITEAVGYIRNGEIQKLPGWLDEQALQSTTFLETYGFSQTYESEVAYLTSDREVLNLSLSISTEVINIEGYGQMVDVRYYIADNEPITFQANGHSYTIFWDSYAEDDLPSLEVNEGEITVVKTSFRPLMDHILEKYTMVENDMTQVPVEDMSYLIETEEFELLVIFDYVGIYVDPSVDQIHYNMEGSTILIKEKK